MARMINWHTIHLSPNSNHQRNDTAGKVEVGRREEEVSRGRNPCDCENDVYCEGVHNRSMMSPSNGDPPFYMGKKNSFNFWGKSRPFFVKF